LVYSFLEYSVGHFYTKVVVLIDLKKAFDTVDHQILLRKLELYGIKGEALTLLKSYLTNRNQKCQIKNSFSTERLIKCGVPQGSILGPLFFLLYRVAQKKVNLFYLF
jgi:hypothetical protein